MGNMISSFSFLFVERHSIKEALLLSATHSLQAHPHQRESKAKDDNTESAHEEAR